MITQALENEYRRVCERRSDINEHLPLLRWVAERCEHVTEFGTRNGISTVALLIAQPHFIVSYDIDPACKETIKRLVGMLSNGTSIEFRHADTTKTKIEETDFLFIDAKHTAANVAAEIENNEALVREYLAFHDTETYGLQGEDGKTPGILTPIMDLVRTGRWETIENRRNNNGMMVLRRAKK